MEKTMSIHSFDWGRYSHIWNCLCEQSRVCMLMLCSFSFRSDADRAARSGREIQNQHQRSLPRIRSLPSGGSHRHHQRDAASLQVDRNTVTTETQATHRHRTWFIGNVGSFCFCCRCSGTFRDPRWNEGFMGLWLLFGPSFSLTLSKWERTSAVSHPECDSQELQACSPSVSPKYKQNMKL